MFTGRKPIKTAKVVGLKPDLYSLGLVYGAKANKYGKSCRVKTRPILSTPPCAFTLAETLIALVIIGIVAAITIPMISRSSEKYILKNQFKKSYSTIINAMNKTDTDLGGNTQCYYLNGPGANMPQTSDCRAFFQQLQNNLSLQKVCDGNAKADGCIPTPYLKDYISQVINFSQSKVEDYNKVFNLADGTIIILDGKGGYPLFLTDVNGAKNPNEFGKDVFCLFIVSDGKTGLRIFPSINVYKSRTYFSTLGDIYKD